MAHSRDTIGRYFDSCRIKYQEKISNQSITFDGTSKYEVDECIIRQVTDKRGEVLPPIWLIGILEQETGQVPNVLFYFEIFLESLRIKVAVPNPQRRFSSSAAAENCRWRHRQ